MTAMAGTAGTYLTVFPAATAVPTASNLNVVPASTRPTWWWSPGQRRPAQRLQLAGLDQRGGRRRGVLRRPLGLALAGLFHPIPPLRICDTRTAPGTACSGADDNLLGANQWSQGGGLGLPHRHPVLHRLGPHRRDRRGGGPQPHRRLRDGRHLPQRRPAQRLRPMPQRDPAFSNLNVNAGYQPAQPGDRAPRARPGRLRLQHLGAINFILDVNGWFGNGSESTPGASFYAVRPPASVTPGRHRLHTECSGDTLGAGATLTIPVAGVDGLPAAGGTPRRWR